MDQEEASIVISVLKIISFLLYFALWIYFEVKEFGSYTSKSFSINIILGFAFALSIIFFCTELLSLLSGDENTISGNSYCIVFTYLTLALAYSGAVSIGDINVGK
ncbi:1931_t:CDS:1, partial [Racocetra persica]